MTEPALGIQRITTLDGFESSAEELDCLARLDPEAPPFVTTPWLRALYETFQDQSSLEILCVRRDRSLVGYLPLFRRTTRLRGVLPVQDLQSSTFSEVPAFAPVAHPDHRGDVVRSLVRALAVGDAGPWDRLVLERLSRDTASTRLLAEILQDGRIPVEGSAFPGSYVLETAGEFEAYFSNLGKSFRNNRKNQNRRLERLGEVRFEIHRTGDPALRLFLEMENTGWKRDRGTSILEFERLGPYYRRLAVLLEHAGQLRIPVLYLSGRPIAAVFGTEWNGVFYYVKAAVDYRDPDLVRKTSPGQALLYHLIRACFQGDVRRFDFCGPFYDYERQWTRAVAPKINLYAYNPRRRRVRAYLFLRTVLGRPLVREALELPDGAQDRAEGSQDR